MIPSTSCQTSSKGLKYGYYILNSKYCFKNLNKQNYKQKDIWLICHNIIHVEIEHKTWKRKIGENSIKYLFFFFTTYMPRHGMIQIIYLNSTPCVSSLHMCHSCKCGVADPGQLHAYPEEWCWCKLYRLPWGFPSNPWLLLYLFTDLFPAVYFLFVAIT